MTDLEKPRTVTEIVGEALLLYGRYPILFLALALAVVAPFELIVLAAVGTAPLGGQSASASTAFVVVLIDFALVGPLISALYVHAAVLAGTGERPSFAAVARRVAPVLPVVAAAEIVAGIGIGIGLLLLVIPGVVLAIHWAVVAQVAAIERTDWIGALRRSGELARSNYLHIFGVLLLTYVINLGLNEAAQGIAGTSARASAVAFGIAVDTLVRSFTGLTTAMLYFDLNARARR